MLWFVTFWGSDSNKTNHITYIFATYDTLKNPLLSCCSYICFFSSVLTCFASTTKNIDRLSICAFGVVTSSFWFVRPKLTKKSTMTTVCGSSAHTPVSKTAPSQAMSVNWFCVLSVFFSFFFESLSENMGPDHQVTIQSKTSIWIQENSKAAKSSIKSVTATRCCDNTSWQGARKFLCTKAYHFGGRSATKESPKTPVNAVSDTLLICVCVLLCFMNPIFENRVALSKFRGWRRKKKKSRFARFNFQIHLESNVVWLTVKNWNSRSLEGWDGHCNCGLGHFCSSGRHQKFGSCLSCVCFLHKGYSDPWGARRHRAKALCRLIPGLFWVISHPTPSWSTDGNDRDLMMSDISISSLQGSCVA